MFNLKSVFSVKVPAKYFSLFFFILFVSGVQAVDVYYKLGYFFIPNKGPFIETYITIAGQSVTRKPVKGGFQSATNISLLVTSESGNIVQANKYNLNGPIYKDTLQIPAFIDNQRYPLANGTYTMELTVTDLNNPQKPFKLVQVIKINYGSYPIQASSIQTLESFKKTATPSDISKSGYDLIPYTVDYYPDEQNKISFYFESYNTDSVCGENKSFIYKYYIENNDNLKPVEETFGFKKATTAPVNPLLAQIDISILPTGNYNLVIEVRDEKNVVQLQEKQFFQRRNKFVEQTFVSGNYAPNSIEKYFRNVKSADTLKIYTECLWPISDMIERERLINQTIKNDTGLMRNYLIDYWTNRAADSVNPMKIWMEYLKSVNEVAILFKCGKQKGYFTDRGRVYLQYGKPNQRSVMSADQGTYPYEIWQYYRINDKANGKFFSNRKFVFVNKAIADDCYRLEHSDMLGEINNPRWRYEVSKSTSGNVNDPDDTNPSNTNSNVNDLFNSPR